ncbi:TIGR03086 family metal-binding protein [Actinacidiphila glaucinigra]|uniref:TIGR03086 family protein n=1 Tax=Actinacidiphila glaucinigra TaxID=235986 RepID=A0A239L671_9ACTN|nr:TIGR03086 family metal-binding protein [Actinacidiphila glaucinigra]SNT25323.1 TIGR03086 family protein [Actinacidiphila glaucinigra]
MTTRTGELLAAARDRALPLVHALPDEALEAPTPCAEYDVRNLLNHLFHVVVGFQALAAREEADFSVTPDRLAEYGDGWRARFEEETELLVSAWAVPGADEGVAGSMNLPARTVGAMALLDLTVHPWDLARATGLPYTPDAEGLRALEELVAAMGPTARKMGVFGEPAPMPAGASAFEALLAGTGRDPRWSRPEA